MRAFLVLPLAVSAVMATYAPTPVGVQRRDRDIIPYEIPPSCKDACRTYLTDLVECPRPSPNPLDKCALCEPDRLRHQNTCARCFSPDVNLNPSETTIANWTAMCISAAEAAISKAYSPEPSATPNSTAKGATASSTKGSGASSLTIPAAAVAVALTLALGLVA